MDRLNKLLEKSRQEFGKLDNNNVPAIFNFQDHEIRVIMQDNEPWWVATDVCKVLALGNVSMAVNGNEKTGNEGLDDDEKGIMIAYTPGGNQKMLCVNEPGLYALIFKSRKPEAKAFKRWITHEVIPAIRKTGGYSVNQELPPHQPQQGDFLTNVRTALGVPALEELQAVERYIDAAKALYQGQNKPASNRKTVNLFSAPKQLPARAISQERQAIIELLQGYPDGLSAPQIADLLGKNYNTVRNILTRMDRQGELQKRLHVYVVRTDIVSSMRQLPAPQRPPSKESRALRGLLIAEGRAMSPKEIAVGLNKPAGTIRKLLFDMKMRGEIIVTDDGYVANAEQHA